MYDLNNKVVLITGAANSIGAGVVRLLLDENVKFVAVLDVDDKNGVKLQKELGDKHGSDKIKFYKVDVTNDDQLYGAYDSVMQEQGYIDVVINNAGIMNDSMQVYKKSIEVNYTALVTSTLKALELMRKDKGGKGGTVINISSIAGLSQVTLLPIYFGTKSAVIQFSNCIGLKDYYERTGVRVLTVCFGATQTSLLDNLASFDKDLETRFPVIMEKYPKAQKMESAALGVIAAYKGGESASTWLATKDEPAIDITDNVKKAYEILEEHIH